MQALQSRLSWVRLSVHELVWLLHHFLQRTAAHAAA